VPYLAEALPELNTESWQVAEDGTMQTSYHLRPNLTWHDGVPLTADDFVFGLDVYKTPELGSAKTEPISLIDDIQAPDDGTVLVTGTARSRGPAALSSVASIANGGFQPFPRHILDQPYRQDTPDAFANEAYWSTQYVGAGPYKLEHWEPGA